MQRQARGPRLRLEHLAPHRVHRHAIDGLVDRRQQACDGAGILLVAARAAPTRCPCRELHDSRIFI